jgi:phosphosulfolactate phosphohydrolase-like enzyme
MRANNNMKEGGDMKTDQITTTLRNGITVAAKRVNGFIFAKTFANRTQAAAAAEKLGDGWCVYQWGRPLFVGRE